MPPNEIAPVNSLCPGISPRERKKVEQSAKKGVVCERGQDRSRKAWHIGQRRINVRPRGGGGGGEGGGWGRGGWGLRMGRKKKRPEGSRSRESNTKVSGFDKSERLGKC